MDNNQSSQPPQAQSDQPVSSVTPSVNQSDISPHFPKTILIVLLFIIVLSVGIGGYIAGANKNPSPKTFTTKYVASHPLIPSPTIAQAPFVTNRWGTFQQQFDRALAYDLQYPLNYNVWVFNGKDVRLPVSPLDLLLSHAVGFTETSLEKSNNNITIGVSDVDPSLCYTTTCQHAIEKITRSSTASISGILAKRIEGTANPGGGIIMPGPTPSIILYVFPTNGRYILLYSLGDNTNVLDKMASSLKVVNY